MLKGALEEIRDDRHGSVNWKNIFNGILNVVLKAYGEEIKPEEDPHQKEMHIKPESFTQNDLIPEYTIDPENGLAIMPIKSSVSEIQKEPIDNLYPDLNLKVLESRIKTLENNSEIHKTQISVLINRDDKLNKKLDDLKKLVDKNATAAARMISQVAKHNVFRWKRLRDATGTLDDE